MNNEDDKILSKINNYLFTSRIAKVNMPNLLEWHINGYIFSKKLLLQVADELKNIIKPDYYIHAFNKDYNLLYVILNGKVFELPSKRDNSWEEMIIYAESLGLERKWTENIPMSI